MQAEGSSAESIAALAKVDIVKQRMEAAYETLQDAAGLTQLSATVEDVFASGDLPRAAETLANMRHCLSAVGEVMKAAYYAFKVFVVDSVPYSFRIYLVEMETYFFIKPVILGC